MPPPSIAVDRERVRLAATEGIAAARAAADGGQHSGAARILESKLNAVEQSAPGAAGDPALEALKEELRDLSLSVGDRRKYEQTGRARLLAGMSSHAQQRASAMGMDVQSTSKARAYLTPKMEEMGEMSRGKKRGNGNNQQADGTSRQAKQVKVEIFTIKD
ncbi:unnamed protein product [Miscanthus lutarioriparius]|uniref:VWA-Hint protein Vwaint domain-containing protein n=1 Tax=Miscanthus lutarioriparius TaxID=422564 RepID=A0A811PU51_9POAL|nr:unnamed protein product [Miscanthus lutarioriparius]